MNYRRLGSAGLKVSELSFGAWVTFGADGRRMAYDCMAAAYDAGVNFFDNAEAYAGGDAEMVMGDVIYASWAGVATAYRVDQDFLGANDGPNDEEYTDPQAPDAGHQRLAQAAGAGLRRPHLLPSPRPEHADRGDGVGHVTS